MITQKKRYLCALIIAMLICIIDQASKYMVMLWYEVSGSSYHVLTSFLNFIKVWNYGVSFGLFQAQSMMGVVVLLLMAAAIMGFIIYLLAKAENWYEIIAYAFILGGALGNMIDRFYYGAVFDFIDMHAFGVHFWTFNIADSAISLGVVFLLLGYWVDFKKTKKNIAYL